MSCRTKESIKDLSDLPTLLKSKNQNQEKEIQMARTQTPMAAAVSSTVQFSDRFPDPAAAINSEEGMDVCIWKHMNDRKKRTLDEIGESLFMYGLGWSEVKDRVVKLTNHRNWFERTGKGNKTQYTLRKGIAMPTNADVKETNGNVVRGVELKPEVKNQPLTPMQAAFQKNMVVVAAKTVVPTANAEPEIKVAPVIPFHQTQPLLKEDGMHLSIWKVMSDYNEYTANEVGLLLSEVGFNPKSVAVNMSTLHLQEGWFDRVKDGPSYRYTLRTSVIAPKPITAQASLISAVKKEAPPVVASPNSGGRESFGPTETTATTGELKHSAPMSRQEPRGADNPVDYQTVINKESADMELNEKEKLEVRRDLVKNFTMTQDQINAGLCKDADKLFGRTGQSFNNLVSNDVVQFTVRFADMEFKFKEIQDLLVDLVSSGFGPDYTPADTCKSKLLSVDIKVGDKIVAPTTLQSLTMYLLSLGFKSE